MKQEAVGKTLMTSEKRKKGVWKQKEVRTKQT